MRRPQSGVIVRLGTSEETREQLDLIDRKQYADGPTRSRGYEFSLYATQLSRILSEEVFNSWIDDTAREPI